ncbi:origin recognition complex subunit 3 N-terminus-domain-containing protein [Biscogniauxia mediterranea]|nr:origin recognition complex subunit 3 N-terminus-domain-containing protein [Biscogniauxia mediterranea]
MTIHETPSGAFEEKQHQGAYIFDPSGEAEDRTRPAKRRKVSKKLNKPESRKAASALAFPRLFGGDESERCSQLRQKLFDRSWSQIDQRIQRILRDANQSTLHQVTSFLQDVPNHAPAGKIPSAFIITGPNLASQDLLFEQLSDTLHVQADATVVRLRSGDASNLKAALKKIIHDTVARGAADENDLELSVSKDGPKFLNYDLEALHAHLKSIPRRHVVIAFQDSEAFESGLLSDLISLFSSWLDRIPFALLFGVATSVELFEARLLKSTCQCLYGDQFDVEQSASIVDKIFKTAVAHAHAPLRLGPNYARLLLERQQDQVASIPLFISSLKYAYMCHFYANPLSIFLADDLEAEVLQKEHIESIRGLPSFRRLVETAVQEGDIEQARLLLDDDKHLIKHVRNCMQQSRQWVVKLLRILNMMAIGTSPSGDFIGLYLDALLNGVDLSDQNIDFGESIKRMQPVDSTSFLTRVLDAVKDGDSSLGLDACVEELDNIVTILSGILADTKQLQKDSEEQGHVLRSKYSGQNKILRATVVAQKVQLSHDAATLTEEDKSYTALIDRLMEHLQPLLRINGAGDMPYNEIWLYDAKTPYRDVFVPRPRTVVERALSRPHDYLGCSCCKSRGDQLMPTLPATAILYQLYLETGSLINTADLWSAFFAIVGEDNEEGLDERTALVLFYRALAEMRAAGFVKQSRKKADHIAKLAWKGL